MIKGILFDKDGTLIEFEKMWHSIMTLVFDALEVNDHISKTLIKDLKDLSGYHEIGFEKESMIQYLSTSKIVEIWATKAAEVGLDYEAMSVYFMNLMELTALDEGVVVETLPGVKTTLTYLKSQGYYLGVATADTKKSMIHSLKKAGILECFDFLGSDDGLLIGKPDPHMAEEFCRVTGIEREALLIVGDSLNDHVFASNSGADFVGIINNYGSFDAYDRHQATLVNDFVELIEVMDL